MTLSDFRHITDELLSAYIDDEVTEQERALVEAAIAQDESIAWRLDSLRQTVTLLHELPEVALPRSFMLTLDQVRAAQTDEPSVEAGVTVGEAAREVVAVPAAPALRPQAARAPQSDLGIWGQFAAGWRNFWQAGNPILRNAAAVSFAIMLMLTGGGQLINRAMQPVGTLATTYDAAPAAAPAMEAASEAAPPDQVALATVTTDDAPPAEADTLPEEPAAPEANARTMQADAAPAAESAEGDAAQEMPADGSAAGETATGETATDQAQAGEPAISAMSVPNESVPDETVPPDSAPAAADAMPPLEARPYAGVPGAGGAGGMGGGGGGPESGAMGGGGGDSGGVVLVPEQAHTFDIDEPTALPAEESVIASVPPASNAASSVAEAPATPAVEVAMAGEAETARAATSEGETEQQSAKDAGETSEEEVAEATAEPTVEPTAEPTVEPPVEPTVGPTPAEAALVGPEPITGSEVIENVPPDNVSGEEPIVAATPNPALPVVWVAQGSALLLTVLLTSLWWRSRRPRR